MRVRIHQPLFAGFLGIVGLLVALQVSLVGTGLRRELVTLTQQELARELDLAALQVELALRTTPPDSLAGLLASRVGHRVTLIAGDGRVLGDSEVPEFELPDVENHRERPEFRSTMESGTIGYAERASGTVGTRFLYAARRVDTPDGLAVLRMAAPLDEIQATLSRSTRAVALVGLAATAVALIVAYLLSRALARPLVTLADRSQRLAQGDFTSRVPRNTQVLELDELAQAFNRLADELKARLQELGRERDEMQALIDCMAEGVVALTEDARVLRTNRAARDLLGFAEPPLFAPVGAIVRQPELRELLEGSVVRPVDARDVKLGDRHLIVSSRRLDQGGAVTTFLDVTEIRRLEQVRQDFVANASHELKTPLTSMRGFAETLLEDDPPEELKREFLQSIRKNTVRLQLLVDDLLDLSRLESGGWRARKERVDLAEMSEVVWDDLESGSTPVRDLEFDLIGDGEVWADAQGVEQILRNLLDNARRYTPDGGRVTVRIDGFAAQPGVSPGGDLVQVTVEDTGAGIPSKSLPRIFERFYRADTSRAREVGGTGLGLAIVRHLVQAMGGEVSASSELGRGTRMSFTLPRAWPREGQATG